jgi:hypothetical protein
MVSPPLRRYWRQVSWRTSFLLLMMAIWLGLPNLKASAQEDLGSCTLRDHVYTCDGTVFQKALATARTVSVQAHNADGVARSQLKNLVSRKLGKTVAPDGSPADLVFLLIPVSDAGEVNYSSGRADLGTLRIYAASSTGSPARLLWAETFSGQPDLPWPTVVHGLILQFESRFHIK